MQNKPFCFRELPQKFLIGFHNQPGSLRTCDLSPRCQMNPNGTTVVGIAASLDKPRRFETVEDAYQGRTVELGLPPQLTWR